MAPLSVSVPQSFSVPPRDPPFCALSLLSLAAPVAAVSRVNSVQWWPLPSSLLVIVLVLFLARNNVSPVRSRNIFCSGAGTCDSPYRKLVCGPWRKVGSSKERVRTADELRSVPNSWHLTTRDGPNVRLWHSAEAEGLGRLTERVPNVRPNFGWMLCSRMKQRVLLVSALSGYKMY